jgi:hypothetical protein
MHECGTCLESLQRNSFLRANIQGERDGGMFAQVFSVRPLTDFTNRFVAS